MATSDPIPALLKRAPQECVVLIVRMVTPQKMFRRMVNLRMAWLGKRSIAVRRLDDEASAGLDDLRRIARRFSWFEDDAGAV